MKKNVRDNSVPTRLNPTTGTRRAWRRISGIREKFARTRLLDYACGESFDGLPRDRLDNEGRNSEEEAH